MPIKKVCLLILIIACSGFINAQARMLEKPVTVMAETELKIERGNCLVYWKPLYCVFPGTGYRVEVQNGTRQGNKPMRSYSVKLNGSEKVSGPKKDDAEGKREVKVYLDGRTILRVTLRGEPGDGIVIRIWGEAGQVNLSSRELPGFGSIHQEFPQQMSAGTEKPLPIVSLKADKEAIAIGQEVKLAWDVQNATTARFSSGDLGSVEASGSAQVWPEKDTIFRLETEAGGETTSAEVQVKVTVPDPELELDVEPKTVYNDQEITITWKTKNARLVRFGEQGYSYLPLSGKKNFKPVRYMPIVLVAENGEKKLRKTLSVNVLDREEERRRAEEEKARRTIPKDIDKTLRGLWQGLKEAMKAGDAEKAASFFCLEERAKYLEIYKDLKDKLPQIGAEMKEIEFLVFQGDGAEYRTKRKETIKGKEYDISYRVYFILDQDGQWRIYKF